MSDNNAPRGKTSKAVKEYGEEDVEGVEIDEGRRKKVVGKSRRKRDVYGELDYFEFLGSHSELVYEDLRTWKIDGKDAIDFDDPVQMVEILQYFQYYLQPKKSVKTILDTLYKDVMSKREQIPWEEKYGERLEKDFTRKYNDEIYEILDDMDSYGELNGIYEKQEKDIFLYVQYHIKEESIKVEDVLELLYEEVVKQKKSIPWDFDYLGTDRDYYRENSDYSNIVAEGSLTDTPCYNCGSMRIVARSVQTRSLDEGANQFNKCAKCGAARKH